MNPKFMDKVTAYAANLVIKERDKYISGMKNEFFSYDLSMEELNNALLDVKELKTENAELKKKVKDLEDRLWGRSKL